MEEQQTDARADGAPTESEAGPGDSEAISDIQNYLASFNKEIQGDGGAAAAVAANDAALGHSEADGSEGDGAASADGTTTYYVTQTPDGYQYATTSQGQFEGATAYYAPAQAAFYTAGGEQAGEAGSRVSATGQLEAIRGYATTADGKTFQTTGTTEDGLQQIVLAVGDSQGQGSEPREIAVTIPASMAGQVGHESTEELLQAVEQQGGSTGEGADAPEQPTFVAMQPGASHDGSDEQQVILNTGNSYQTVTIVPSDTNPGEVSYVLIVSQPEDGKEGPKGGDVDMSVYDFNEGGEKHTGELAAEEAAAAAEAGGQVVAKMRTIKITPKKSQTVTQAHMCNYCNYTSPKRYLLSRHMKSHSEERPHKCSVCERGFKTLASLQNHVNTHTGTRPHQCKECEAAFTTSGELVRHVRYRHTHEKPHRCTECDYASVELSKLKRHMRCHTGERPYQCPHCTYASPDTYKLKRHLRIHTGEKPYECDVCHARFTQSNSLKAHKLIHSGNKPVFQCELCPTTCGRKTDLRIHVQKLHTSDKPLKCKRCGKSFPDRYTYKVHVKSHEGEKCFKCDLCPYASISQRHLESHMLIHTDQKPFRCDECDQAFRQKQLLKRHKNLYHDPNYVPPIPKEKTHECPECSKAFRHKGNLIRHLAIHDPEATAAERAEAMRIGEPKGPGEEPDGEEDDFMVEEEEEEEMDDLGMEDGMMGEGQQVVVFEVIQIPAADGVSMEQHAIRAITSQEAVHVANNGGVLTTTGADGQELTIIQQVPQDQQQHAIVAEVVKGGMGPTIKRSRGRPRKYATMEMAASQDEMGMMKVEMDGPQREAEMARRRLEQKQKDMDECFGFNDEEDETILAMPAAADVSGAQEEKAIHEDDGNTTTYILMQENGETV